MAPLIRNLVVSAVLYVVVTFAWLAWGFLLGAPIAAQLEAAALPQSVEGYVTVALELPVLLLAGVTAMWLLEGRQRGYWVVLLACCVGITFAAVVPRAQLIGYPVRLLVLQASIAAAVAVPVLLGAWLFSALRSRLGRSGAL